MKVQTISRDGYGTTVILQTSSSIELAIKKIRSEITGLNFDNALTQDDKYRTIEAYFPVFIKENGDIDESLVYAGDNMDGKHRFYRLSDTDSPKAEIIDSSLPVRIFIGSDNGKDKYLQDTRNKDVNSLGHELLEEKTYYFIKVV